MEIDSVEKKTQPTVFNFKNKDKCEQLVKDYYNDRLTIKPKELFNAFGDIKNIIYNDL